MQRNKSIQPRQRGSFFGLLTYAAVMCMLMVVLVAVAKNIIYVSEDPSLPLLEVPKSQLMQSVEPTRTLVIYEDEEMGNIGRREIGAILDQMRIPYDLMECGDVEDDTSLEKYDTLVISVTGYQYLGAFLNNIRGWVRAGGDLMVLYPPEFNSSFESIFGMLGIRDCGAAYVYVDELIFEDGFLVGAGDVGFPVLGAYESSLSAYLEDGCEVFCRTAGEYPTPLVWRHEYGKGTVVVDNLGYLVKEYRGLHSSAFSLLGDACVYPVINSAAFYIDDFPSPVPAGYNQFIQRDYQMSTKDFYTSQWWPDVYNLAEKYEIKYTAFAIETYSDQVEPPFERNEEYERYRYFGNMLLREGGEIGIRGYNNMPLMIQESGVDEAAEGYKLWPGAEEMRQAMGEVLDYCRMLYPGMTFRVYAPPANIISEEGIALLGESFLEMKIIASSYTSGEGVYEQEFRVEDNGFISTPRILFGYMLNAHDRLAALAELNLHFVSSHSQHPYDVLDAERGGEQGWQEMIESLESYTDWLYTSAPSIRNMTGSELAAAVERFDYVEMERIEREDGLTLKLTNFFDEAWFVLRLNDGRELDSITGGTAERLNDTLWLVCAEEAQLELTYA